MIPSHLDPFLYSITSPLVIVDESGRMCWGNQNGEQAYRDFSLGLMSVSAKTLQTDIEALAGFAMLNWATWIASNGRLVKFTPVLNLQNGPRLAILEWISDANEEKLKIIQEVGKAVNSSLILEDIFESLGEVLYRHIPYQEAVIVILDDTQNGIKILVRTFSDGRLEISGEHNAFAGYEPIIDRVLHNPVSQLYQEEAFLTESMLFSQHAASAIVVPLINKGVVIGLIALAADQSGSFTAYQEQLLAEVSAQLAVAVENAKFYWQTQAQASREFLINQLTRSIRQSLDIDIILKTAVSELGKVTGVSRCFIRYFSSGTGSAQVFQYLMPGVSELQMAEEQGFETRVFELRKDQPYNPFILNDVRDCPSVLAEQTWLLENDIKSLAVFPILVRDVLVGTITLHQCDAFRVWVMEDIELFKAFAEHLGVALYQAQLFVTLEDQKRELEHALEELQQAQLYLIQSEKMAVLGQFVAGIAHEVNTPLGTMVSNNATLKVCVDKLDKALKDSSGSLQDGELINSMQDLLALNKLASTRITDIVKNLRNFARLDESELKTVDLHEGLESTLLLIKSSLDGGIRIEKQYEPELPAVQCYPGLLNQVFMNLLVNAIHALAERPPQNTAKITIETRYLSEKKRVVIAFHDTGKGIQPENLSKVFDPGFTTKGVGVGTGLGLALCYRIMEKHQGRIYVESTVDQGTSFFVEIPVSAQQL